MWPLLPLSLVFHLQYFSLCKSHFHFPSLGWFCGWVRFLCFPRLFCVNLQMERSYEGKFGPSNSNNPRIRPQRMISSSKSNVAQICLRAFAAVTSAVSAYLMLTSKEEAVVYGISMSARYNYSPAFKYAGYINIVASASALISLIITTVQVRKGILTSYFLVFLHDLVMTSLLVGGCAAAAAIGYVGKHGCEEAGWSAICNHFGSFCNRIATSVVVGFASTFFFLLLVIFSAIRVQTYSSLHANVNG
ncbi:CASP-like protein [Drosera capensis]